jgi:hypothetical protein
MWLGWIVALSAVVLGLGSIPSAQYYFPGPIDPPSVDSIEEILVMRGCATGGMPSTEPRELIFRRNGSATSRTFRMCDRCPLQIEQALTSTLMPEQFSALAELFIRERFFGLESQYVNYKNKDYDQCSVTTTAVYRGGVKSVSNVNDEGPLNLRAIENAIAALNKTLQWVKAQ